MMPMFAGPSWTVGRLYGVPISLHWTLVLLLAVRAVQALWQVAFPHSLVWIGVVLLIAGSILFHEMAHAMMARRRGYRTSKIELHAFGGLAWIDGDMRDRDQIAVSAAGPFSNLFLWLVFMGLGNAAGPYTHLGSGLREVGYVNLILGLFNLLPAYPLDGGSVFLSWLRMRAPHSQAGWLAFTTGQWIGGLMGLYGLFFNEIFTAMIGLLVFQACTARLSSVGAVGGWPFWKARLTGGRSTGKLDIDWAKYSPQRPKTMMERIKGFFSRRGRRDTPRGGLRVIHPDEPDDRPPTIN
jgi:Zn-dependent protease